MEVKTVEVSYGGSSAVGSAYAQLLAWVVLGVFIWLINKTRVGHTIIYYSLVLMLFLLVVTQYQQIAASLKPISGK